MVMGHGWRAAWPDNDRVESGTAMALLLLEFSAWVCIRQSPTPCDWMPVGASSRGWNGLIFRLAWIFPIWLRR
jgi:hypothetical protein